MDKNKAQTLQQRMGFLDEDLKSITHDEMMSLFLEEEWVNDFLIKLFPKLKEIEFKIDKPRFETSVFRDKYMIGFIDVIIGVGFPKKGSDYLEWHKICIEIKSHSKISAGELIRQIETYRNAGYYDKCRWVLFVNGEYPMKKLLLASEIRTVEYFPINEA